MDTKKLAAQIKAFDHVTKVKRSGARHITVYVPTSEALRVVTDKIERIAGDFTFCVMVGSPGGK